MGEGVRGHCPPPTAHECVAAVHPATQTSQPTSHGGRGLRPLPLPCSVGSCHAPLRPPPSSRPTRPDPLSPPPLLSPLLGPGGRFVEEGRARGVGPAPDDVDAAAPHVALVEGRRGAQGRALAKHAGLGAGALRWVCGWVCGGAGGEERTGVGGGARGRGGSVGRSGCACVCGRGVECRVELVWAARHAAQAWRSCVRPVQCAAAGVVGGAGASGAGDGLAARPAAPAQHHQPLQALLP